MDKYKKAGSLENKLLLKSTLSRPLQSSLTLGALASRRPKATSDNDEGKGDVAKPKLGFTSNESTSIGKLKNPLLSSNLGKDLTTNKLLLGSSTIRAEKTEKSKVPKAQAITPNLAAGNLSSFKRPSLESKLVLTARKSSSTSTTANEELQPKVDLKPQRQKSVLKSSIIPQSEEPLESKYQKKFSRDQGQGKVFEDDKDFGKGDDLGKCDDLVTRPVYELAFDEENLSKELFGREKEHDDFAKKVDRKSEAEKQKKLLDEKKIDFLNIASISMLKQPDFYDRNDESRIHMIKAVKNLRSWDPEFVLKVALYVRQELNIRTGTNFILALAAFNEECRPYLKRYFNSTIVLPSDWIEVAEFYQTLNDKDINFGSLPTALRKVMIERFPKFDQYQLAKYNKEKARLKKGKDTDKGPSVARSLSRSSSDSSSDSDSDSESEEEIRRKAFTLKQLIRKLHIFEPVYPVMCLIGKKYPSSQDEFRHSRLGGIWNEAKAGKRMKLPTPETWETQVSLKGNKASTWEQLLDHKKLPFMAMLRNLRNMLQAGISDKHHNMVIKRLTDEKSVVNSRQFPFRFFSAYDVLNDLQTEYEGSLEKAMAGVAITVPLKKAGRGRGRGAKRQTKTIQLTDYKYDSDLIKRYRNALDTALRISCIHNITPMPGSSIIIVNCSENLDQACNERSMGRTRTMLEVGLLLGLIAKYSCEECKLLLFLDGKFVVFEIENQGTILTNLVKAQDRVKQLRQEKKGEDTKEFLLSLISDQVKMDNVMYISLLQSNSEHALCEFLTNHFAKKYRMFVNPEMLLVLDGLDIAKTSDHPKDLILDSYSDQILRFIAERGNSTLLTHVDNIDLAFNLRDIQISRIKSNAKKPAISFSPKIERSAPWWKNVRVFISSTFRDMHGERDLLTRYVFPELRSRAMQHFINIYEIDLRWGITEEQSKSKSQIEICLSEVLRSDIFIGILGDRYGWIPENFDPMSITGCERLQGFCDGTSITEMEMRLFALTRGEQVAGKAFFYSRDRSLIDKIPREYMSDFSTEDADSVLKLTALKEEISKSGFELSLYSGSWGGVVDGKPIVSNLEEFGNRVLNNVWTSIKNNYLKETERSEGGSDGSHEAYAEKALEHFVGRKAATQKCMEIISTCKRLNCGVLMVAGKSGSGKTSFMAKLYSEHVNERGTCPCFFADAVPDSRSVQDLVRYLFISLQSRVDKQREVPDSFRELQNEFANVLEDAGKKRGDNDELAIFIDGMDLLETAGKMSLLGWLPDPVPKGILFVISCLDSGTCAKTLEARRKGVESVRVGALDMMERTEFVRRLLKKHRKELDESAFNNQMKLLVSKREANLPIFLKFACEELRFFGVYEKVSEHLRQLAQTVPMLLQSIANRLEGDHGKELVTWSLLVLYVSRQDLSEDELYEVICCIEACQYIPMQRLDIHVLIDSDASIAQNISRSQFAILTRSLKSFIQQSEEQSLQLSFSDVRNLVKQKYVHTAGSENVTRIHRVLAAYFKKRAFDGNWLQADIKALSEIVYHMAAGGMWDDLEETLCSLSFVYAKFRSGLGLQLLEDFLVNVENLSTQLGKQRQNFLESPRVEQYRAFVSKNMHILNQYPVLVIQQALNDAESQLLNDDAAQCSTKHTAVQWLNKPTKASPIKRTMTSFNQAVLALDVSPDGKTVVCGTQDGVVRMFDVATGNDSGNFIGHADSITSCRFVGPQKLVSASADCTMSVWDVAGGHRIHRLKGHRRGVTSCIPVPSSQQVVTVSLDCIAILWDIQHGQEIERFKSGSRPYNCVASDPAGRLVALGGWDCNIKVWDILRNKRQNLLKGHESSVRALGFSPSGNHIVSAALLGDVYMWAVQSGTRVGKFSLGSMTMSTIQYTRDGLQMLGACADSSVKVWSGSLGRLCGTIRDKEGDGGWVRSVAVDIEGKFLYVGHNNGKVVSYHYSSGAYDKKYDLHKAAVRDVCVSKLGTLLVTGSDDRTAKVVNLSDSTTVTLNGHTESVRCVSTSNALIATGSDDYTIMLWESLFFDEKSGIKPVSVLRKHTGHVTCCDFSPCGTRLMSGSTDKSLIIWDILSRTPLHVLNNCHRDWINACAWSDVGDFVVTGSNDFTLKLWDAKTGTEKYQFLGNTSAINGVSYKFGCVASTAFDGSLRIWTHKGSEITTIPAHKERANAVCLWKPAKETEGSWDIDDPGQMSTNELIKSNKPSLEDVDVLTVSDDGTVKKWKPFVPNLIENLNGHTDVVASIAVSPSGEDVFSCSYDKTIKCWDPQKFDTRDPGHTTQVNHVRISPDGANAVSCGRDGYVAMWSLSSCKVLTTFKASSKGVNCLCFMDENRIAVGDDLSVLRLFRVDGQHIAGIKVDVREPMSPVTAIAKKGNYIACATYKRICVYMCKDRMPTKWVSSAVVTTNGDLKDSWVLDLDISEDGLKVAAAHTNGLVSYIEIKETKTTGMIQTKVKINPNQKSYADTITKPTGIKTAWRFGETAELKVAMKEKVLVNPTTEHCGITYQEQPKGRIVFAAKMVTLHSKVYTLCVTSDGYVVSLDGKNNETKAAFKIHDKAVNGLAVVDRYFITSSNDTTVKVWELDTINKKDEHLKQVGLFFCRGPVTTLDAKNVNGKCMIFAGDKTGNVEILQFVK